MSIRLIALGHKAPAWINEGCNQYRNRLPREWQFDERLLKAERRSEHTPTEQVKAREAERIEDTWKECSTRIVLDEHGRMLTSRELAAFIEQHRQQRESMAWVIGGTDGLDTRIVKAAHLTLSLSRLTLPHDMARLMLMEQLYRASTVISGHPYHRD